MKKVEEKHFSQQMMEEVDKNINDYKRHPM